MGLAQARPNYSEKLRKPFWSGSAISNAASLYVVSKVEISANSLTVHIKLKHFRSFSSGGKNNPFKKILPVFSCFS